MVSMMVSMALLGMPASTMLGAQVRPQGSTPPPEVVDAVLELANDATTSRFEGATRIAIGRTISGTIAVMNGRLTVAGTVQGDVIVLNGDLEVVEGGRITGRVWIAGGRLRGAPSESIEGEVTQYTERIALVSRQGQLSRVGPRRVDRRGLYLGGTRITVRAGTNYNRVEGLPVLFGPVFQTSSRNPLRFEALAIWRTEDERTRDRFGYTFRAEQTLGSPQARISIGGSAFSRVRAIESWGLNDLEASLSSFLFHLDHRDYYEERGWSVNARTQLPWKGADIGVEYTDRRMSALSVAAPWSVFENGDPWRPLPLVATGTLQTLSSRLTIDERNDPLDPTDGWYLDGRIMWGTGGKLTLPNPVLRAEATNTSDLGPGVPQSTSFRSGFLDVRRYARLSPDHDLALRFVAGGSLGGDLLPPQLQHALGGEGSLPGYRLMSIDCGARSQPLARSSETNAEVVFQRYGCSQFTLFQAEYRGRLPFGGSIWNPESFDEAASWLPGVDLTPSWVLFFNAGRGWSQNPDLPDTDTVADLGGGLLIGKLGLYLAVPLTETDRSLNFFVRLQKRF